MNLKRFALSTVFQLFALFLFAQAELGGYAKCSFSKFESSNIMPTYSFGVSYFHTIKKRMLIQSGFGYVRRVGAYPGGLFDEANTFELPIMVGVKAFDNQKFSFDLLVGPTISYTTTVYEGYKFDFQTVIDDLVIVQKGVRRTLIYQDKGFKNFDIGVQFGLGPSFVIKEKSKISCYIEYNRSLSKVVGLNQANTRISFGLYYVGKLRS